MFLHLYIILFTRGVWLPSMHHRPQTDTPLGKHLPPSGGRHPLGRQPPGRQPPLGRHSLARHPPLAGTPIPRITTEVGGTHPTGMYSSLSLIMVFSPFLAVRNKYEHFRFVLKPNNHCSPV